MKIHVKNIVLFLMLILINQYFSAQESKVKSDFWQKVQFGGGLGLGFGNGFANISVAPSAIYNFNEFIAAGVGVQYNYLKQRQEFTSHLYGTNLIGLFQPIEVIQLSLEVEQLRVNQSFDANTISRNFWNTGLFVGAGYRSQNVTIGARYNLLFQEDKGVYGTAFMPFVRVFF